MNALISLFVQSYYPNYWEFRTMIIKNNFQYRNEGIHEQNQIIFLS